LKKVGRVSSRDLFSIWCFLNLHALGYPKSETIFCAHFWVIKYLSMLCVTQGVCLNHQQQKCHQYKCQKIKRHFKSRYFKINYDDINMLSNKYSFKFQVSTFVYFILEVSFYSEWFVILIMVYIYKLFKFYFENVLSFMI
jgi:hypothetical protein